MSSSSQKDLINGKERGAAVKTATAPLLKLKITYNELTF